VPKTTSGQCQFSNGAGAASSPKLRHPSGDEARPDLGGVMNQPCAKAFKDATSLSCCDSVLLFAFLWNL
jgi:hypothetical protein